MITVRSAATFALVAGILVGGGLALASWSTTVHNGNGEICASVWHYHPGSSYLPHGGEMTDAERAAFADDCDQRGAGPWRTGWIELGAGVATAAVAAVALLSRRRSRVRP